MVLTSQLGTGVHRPDRRPRPWSRARRAARRPGSRARCHHRRRVTAPRLTPANIHESKPGSNIRATRVGGEHGSEAPRDLSAPRLRPWRLGWSVAQHGARRTWAGQNARIALARSCMFARRGRLVTRARHEATWRRAASLHGALGSKASIHRWSSHGVGGPGGMSGPRALHERDAAVLRLEGRHPGMAARRRTPTPSVLNRAEFKEGGKGEGVCGGAHVGVAV
jgi:hypothetical protein